MSKLPLDPFNIKLLIPPKGENLFLPTLKLPISGQIKSNDIFDGQTRNLHPDGLYSTKIFGTTGTADRSKFYSYINIKIPVLHPLIYKTIINLKGFYLDIINSVKYAVWDDQINDFVQKDNVLEGDTGYEFFITHFTKIKFEQRKSISREESIKFFEKYKDNCLIDKIIVIPADYRDIELDEGSRYYSDEINGLYSNILTTANTINDSIVKNSPETYNRQRITLQKHFNALYDYLEKIVEGKKNLLMGKFASRKIFNSTRNVITSASTVLEDLEDETAMSINDIYIGLYQSMQNIKPITIHSLRNGILSKIFFEINEPVLLVNKDTLKSEMVKISNYEYERWLTNEGMSKIINYFKENTIRHNPVKVDDHYLCLIYKGPNNTFKLIHGIDELPIDKKEEYLKYCTPITWAELFYIHHYNVSKVPVMTTRYPITGIGSTFPAITYLKTTIEVEKRIELDDNWEPTDNILNQFPIRDSNFYNSISSHPSRLKSLGADFDGDMQSTIALFTDESKEEINDFLNSKGCYVGSSGESIYDLNTDTIKYVLQTMTKDIE